MKIIGIILLAVGALALLIYAALNWFPGASAYQTYTNTQYGYEIDYPADFVPQGESQNGDGQVFERDNASLRVFGIANIDNESLEAVAEGYMLDTNAAVVAETADTVTLRTESEGVVRTVKAITLQNNAVGIAILEYNTGVLDEDVRDVILISFHSTATVGEDTDSNGDEGQDDDIGDGSGVVPVGYRLYQSNNLAFSILAPESADIGPEGQSHVKIQLLGPDNEPDTEVTDGLTLTVFRDTEVAEYTSVQAYADAVIEDTRAGSENEITSELEARTVNGMTAYRYAYRGALGSEVTEYVFLPDDSEEGYRISYSIADPNNEGYESVALTMLESVRYQDDAANPPTVSSVELAMLDYTASGGQYTNESTGPERGCDRVVMVDRTITPTAAPLTAALRALFALETDTYGGWQHFLHKTNDTLSFDRARVADSVAHIYLNGSLTGLAGVCDNPRAAIQIEETALQFETVDTVQLYLNGEETDLIPSEQGA